MHNNECLVCKRNFLTLAGLHIHIQKTEKLLLQEYYNIFFPKKDYFSNENLIFKSKDQYFSSYFNSKENMLNWFSSNYKSDLAKEISLKVIEKRVAEKNIEYVPCEVELRTIDSPSVMGFEKIFEDSYDNISKKFNLKKKYQYSDIKIKPPENILIITDTREQNPFFFKNYRTRKIDIGDYTAADDLFDNVYVERKSIEDFFSTFSSETNFERFKKELVRCNNYDGYLYIIIERPLNECLNYSSFFAENQNLITFTFHNVRKLCQAFENCQFIFAKNKFVASVLCQQCLINKQDGTIFDWQYAIDKKII